MSLTNQQLNSRSQSPLIIPERIIETDTSTFTEKFNRSPFMFSHNLADHPLFDLPRLVTLADTILSQNGRITCQSSKVSVDRKWADIPPKDQVAECLAQIEDSESWLLLYNVQIVPEYRALLEQIIGELEELTGVPLHKQITWRDAYIFVASPHSITPYHIDHESTFLFQIHGARTANIFNPYDPTILSEQEIERYYIGDLSAANYTQEKQKKANVYPLVAGKGVHHPVRAPHCFQNGNSYSVAMGVHFCMRPYDLQARIYQVNFILRQLRLEPKPPGKSALSDKIKIWVMGLLSKRKPGNKYELIRSGVMKLRSLAELFIGMKKWIKR
ncbi:hypothetical protein [Nostoc sp. TCL26-01]|uniref:hypothetical protein n=1 Tax=Nostoc sp. TCL26-01 TaxID=2576904 RepID=UPI0015C144ED|nr:hypothetical protein [Nostoc sp. TCL26-01]QLE58474.1 hypothetical protein FD725_24975 [Nostoc sp. TCL26-01]